MRLRRRTDAKESEQASRNAYIHADTHVYFVPEGDMVAVHVCVCVCGTCNIWADAL